MEAEEGNLHFFHELKTGISTHFRNFHRICKIIPRANCGVRAEHILSTGCHSMPVSHREAQVLRHGLVSHNLIRIVVSEGQEILGLFPFKLDLAYLGKKLSHNKKPPYLTNSHT